MITFIGFMDRYKLRYNKSLFASDPMYRAKVINQHLRKFRVYCNQHPEADNDLRKYENEVWEFEQKIKKSNW